jgi:hypothetical protein
LARAIFRDSDIISVRCVHHVHAFGRRGRHVHIVHADARTGHDTQPAGLGQHLGRNLHAAADNHAVVLADDLRQFRRRQARLDVDLHVRLLLQPVQSDVAELVSNQNLYHAHEFPSFLRIFLPFRLRLSICFRPCPFPNRC